MSTAVYAGMPGGAQEDSLSTSEAYVDLTALAGYEVQIFCDDQDIWVCFNSAASGSLVTSGDSAASLTSLKADRIAVGTKMPRLVLNKYPFLVVKTVTGTGTLHVKPVRGPL